MTSSDPTAWWHGLPAVNASLNGASAALLVGAFVAIKNRKVALHAALNISAFATSAVFLACYLTYHTLKSLHGETLTTFPAGPWRPIYLLILVTHTLLAIVILPLIFSAFFLAWKKRWKLHHKVGMVTLPLWLYVSVTGVVVYWMLYHLIQPR